MRLSNPLRRRPPRTPLREKSRRRPQTSATKRGSQRASLDKLRRRRALRARLRIALILLGAAAVVGAVGWLLYFSPYLTATRVEVQGAQILKPADVIAAAKAPLDTPLARVDVAAIRRRVAALPAAGSVEVSRSWPHTITVSVTERTPVAVVDRGAGLQYLDRTGVVFGALAQRPGSLPLIQAAGAIDQAALAQAGQVAAALSAGLRQITDVVTVKSVDDIELQLRGGRTVLWGSAAESDTKAHIADLLLRQPVKVVDVSVPDRPTTS